MFPSILIASGYYLYKLTTLTVWYVAIYVHVLSLITKLFYYIVKSILQDKQDTSVLGTFKLK
jgi:hypothetical protein